MKKLWLLLLVGLISFSVFAQKRDYLLHTDANINRLKGLIEKNDSVRLAWEEQLENADNLLVKDRFTAADVRRDGQVLIHALSKYTALVQNFQGQADVVFQGQPITGFSLHSPKKKSSISVNDQTYKGDCNSQTKLVKTIIQ